MTSRKVSVNMSRERSTMESLKKTIESSHNFLHDEDVSIKDLKAKNAREWKHVPEEKKMDCSWFLKEKYQGNPTSIHLYCATFSYLKNNYHSLRLLRYFCLVLGKDFVYALVKQAKTYVKMKYCLNISNYKIDEIFTVFCAGVVHDIEHKSVSFYIFVCF